MTSFGLRFPDLAARETRVVTLLEAHGPLPAGSYAFLELYCTDPDCDCRRVLIQVRPEAEPVTVLATINYGWERLKFYTQWLHGDRQGAREIRNASLDPLNPQSVHAPIFLQFFKSVLMKDRDYIQRLARHYRMFKSLDRA